MRSLKEKEEAEEDEEDDQEEEGSWDRLADRRKYVQRGEMSSQNEEAEARTLGFTRAIKCMCVDAGPLVGLFLKDADEEDEDEGDEEER